MIVSCQWGVLAIGVVVGPVPFNEFIKSYHMIHCSSLIYYWVAIHWLNAFGEATWYGTLFAFGVSYTMIQCNITMCGTLIRELFSQFPTLLGLTTRSYQHRPGRHVTVYHSIWYTEHIQCIIWHGLTEFIEPVNHVVYFIREIQCITW